jgi:hypothetical protein
MWIAIIVVLIVVGALAYRSATYIFGQVQNGYSARLAVTFSRSPARQFLPFYVIAGLPLAFVNGFLLRLSWIDCVVVGIGTWVGMLVSIAAARRFNPVIQLWMFGGATVVWCAVDIVRAFTRES